jgi:hypothetical protein
MQRWPFTFDARADLSRRAHDVTLSPPLLARAETLSDRGVTYLRSESQVNVEPGNQVAMDGLLNRLAELLGLERDWDSYGGLPIQGRIAEYVANMLSTLLASQIPPPSIVPTSSGGLQLEWHRLGSHLEIEADPSGEVTFSFRGDHGAAPVGGTVSQTLEMDRLDVVTPYFAQIAG